MSSRGHTQSSSKEVYARLHYKIFRMSFKTQFIKSYSIGSNTISRTDTHKDLGIMISSNLLWEAHYNSILSKAYKM